MALWAPRSRYNPSCRREDAGQLVPDGEGVDPGRSAVDKRWARRGAAVPGAAWPSRMASNRHRSRNRRSASGVSRWASSASRVPPSSWPRVCSRCCSSRFSASGAARLSSSAPRRLWAPPCPTRSPGATSCRSPRGSSAPRSRRPPRGPGRSSRRRSARTRLNYFATCSLFDRLLQFCKFSVGMEIPDL